MVTQNMRPADQFGFFPITINPVLADNAYAAWKNSFLVACSNGEYSVQDESGNTFSEGIGYGMLLTVAHDERTEFDGLWNYYKARRNGNGVMNWRYQGCNTSATEPNGATDAELDAAMALIQAECKWGGYAADANALLSAIWGNEVQQGGGVWFLKPGDQYGGESCVNPSYFSPGYYRAFANFGATGEWSTLATDTYTVLERVTNSSTGLVPNWSTINGPTGTNCNKQDENIYGFDAARTPWRIATDYVWWETAQAKTWLDRLTNWTDAQDGGINYIQAGHELAGAPLETYTTNTFIGGIALAAMAHSQERADAFGIAFAGTSDSEYFHVTLRALYMLLATGKFQKGC